jgi:hypothetical protein
VAGRSAAWLKPKVVASVRIANRESSFVIELFASSADGAG